MNPRLRFASAALAASLICSPIATPAVIAAAPADVSPLPSLAPIVKRDSPAVVNIATRGTVKAVPPSTIRYRMTRSSADSSRCRRMPNRAIASSRAPVRA